MSGRDPWAYGRPLTFPMKLVLRAVADADSVMTTPGEWLLLTDRTDLRSLLALERRGLVDYQRYLHKARLTPAGREVALALYKHKGGA